ncbi:MAG: hypothetical protein K5697_09755 [Lachnospiraceae bacterium]|nr:hypothetical protein [Lachnospiraceae bacterium]
MNKDFEKEYKKLIEEDPPALWDRIEKMVDAAIAEGPTAAEEAETGTEAVCETEEDEAVLAAGVAEVLGGAEQKTEMLSEEKKDDESGSEADDEAKGVIAGEFGASASEKAADAKEGSGKKKKVFNWRRWVLPAAALLCVAIMIPVVITIMNGRTKQNETGAPMAAADNSVMADMAMAEASTDAAAEVGEDKQSLRGETQGVSLVPQHKADEKGVEPAEGEVPVVVEADEPENAAPVEEADWDEEEEEDYDDEDYEDEDEEDWDEDEEEEEELVNAIIYITIDEDTPASVIDEIAAQFGLSNQGYDEEYDEYHLAVPSAMTEEALDDLVDAIDENENVWSVYWDYAE